MIKNSSFRWLAIAALVAAPISLAAYSTAQHPEGGKPEGRPDGPRKDHGPAAGLEDSMQMLQGGMKRLEKALEKGEMETVLKTAVDMQGAAHAAKTQTPERAADMKDEKAKAEFVLGFRKQMITLEKALLDLENAALDNKIEDIKKIVTDSLKPLKKDGHAKYKGD